MHSANETAFLAMEVIAPIVNFAIVVGILVYFGRKPTAQFFVGRRQGIAKEVEGAGEAAVVAAAELQAVNQKWENAKREAPAEFESFQRALRHEQQLALTSTQEQAARLLREAGRFEASNALRMRDTVERRAMRAIVDLTRTALEKKLDGNDQHRLVNRYVEGFTNGHR